MGDVLGILMFVVFIFLSIAGKAMQEKQRHMNEKAGEQGGRPRGGTQWPGPVAGPGLPGYPRPVRNWPRPDVSVPPAPSSPEGEGVGTEGAGMEGPGPGDTTEAELIRFDREIRTADLEAQAIDREVAFVRNEAEQISQFDPASRQLGMLERSSEAAYAIGTAGEQGGLDMQDLLGSPTGLQQAVVMAEVLGKPVALRGPRRMVRQ